MRKYKNMKELKNCIPIFNLMTSVHAVVKRSLKIVECERCPTYNLISHIINLPHLGSIS